MPAYNVFFFSALFFILGILFFNLFLGKLVFILSFIILGGGLFLWFLFKEDVFLKIGFLSLFIILGSFYASFFSINLEEKAKNALNKSLFEGLVYKNFSKETKSEYLVKTKEINFYLKFSYPLYIKEGEVLYFDISKANIKKAPSYFLKEKVIWLVENPQILKVEEGKSFLSKLLIFKNKVIDYFYSILPYKEAALLSGLILGERIGFSSDFYEAMKKSGTTHIVALSGYNISLLVIICLTFFLYFLPRSLSLILTFLFIIFFVFMTGGESSLVRAAILGILVMIGKEIGRLYDQRNIIILTAALMLIFNPFLLLMDIGFVLSFLSFIGIVYLKPLLFLSENENKDEKTFQGIFSNIFKETVAAQIMVLPVLLLSFGVFSPLSFLSNILILWLVPFLMIGGIVSVFVGFIFDTLGVIIGWILYPFLKIETFLIELFGSFNFLWGFKINWIFLVFYYVLLLFLVLWRKNYIKKYLS